MNACNGSLYLDWNAYQQTHPWVLGNPWSVGDKAYVQAWYRDPTGPCAGTRAAGATAASRARESR